MDAASARRDLERYQAWAEKELNSWREHCQLIKGQRDGFQALFTGFYRAIKAEMGEGAAQPGQVWVERLRPMGQFWAKRDGCVRNRTFSSIFANP